VCGKEYLSEEITHLEKLSTLDEGEENDQIGTAHTRGLAQVLLEAAMEVETADINVLPPEGKGAPDKTIEEATLGKTETRSSLASLLFAACDVCVYCGGKFCRDGTI
jgi:hypothetical protein